MTGFNAKRKMALAKLDDDDDTQVYADTLLIVYQRGFADGKRSAQRKPLTDDEMKHVHYDMIVAWAADPSRVVEVETDTGWQVINTPVWRADSEYRFKPAEPLKPPTTLRSNHD